MAQTDKPSGSSTASAVPETSKQPLEEELDEPPVERFPPEEEAKLLAESQQHKTKANSLFASGSYQDAIDSYQEAVSLCPHYLYYDLAVLHSNVAACHLKLEQWKEAIKSATDSLKGLERVDREILAGEEELERSQAAQQTNEDDDVEEEIVSVGAQSSGPGVPKQDSQEEQALRKRREDVARIRAKALMRRARAKSELGGWSNLSGAEEDYKQLSGMSNLGLADKKLVHAQLRDLPARIKAAQEKEMGEMWGKLKDLGNGLLKPFGLSTNNFNMVKDEKTGGYSMNFSQDPPTK
ncbi:uncharacterized protein B0I36DRAFT_238350 [Microdochium trichocladiopsis]|uniref:Tetratricopeptide repeat protein 1 n=1 Tax=Microdochium trichocladiopsis TaxID=1682393 RepID=A0A9P8YC68_9PEZI|nr:uncharacterized protein B0I36DRAFT_238350 [Microdochium trichocladiopsis]KAH7035798.1 hypothetical protein B0I36DRAFT_238350 [Microdochium trichocladiopsis]